MNLLVDIGNTALKACMADGTTLGKIVRYQGENPVGFIASFAEKKFPEVIVISSPYPFSDSETSRLESLCRKLVVLNADSREASVTAARRMFKGRSCTVFDFGTTISIDVLSSNGDVEGSFLSPGYMTRFKALNRYSRSLPLVFPGSEIPAYGSSTETSITAGVVSGIIFEIEGHMAARPDNVNIFTGGDAIFFANRMKNRIFVVCNLVLMGLAMTAEQYERQQDK